MKKITIYGFILILLFSLLIVIYNKQSLISKVSNDSLSITTNKSFFENKTKIIDAINSQIDTIIPFNAPPTLKWHTEAISFLQPNYILVLYSEGHRERIALFLVDTKDEEVTFNLILDGPYDGNLPPIAWDWKAT